MGMLERMEAGSLERRRTRERRKAERLNAKGAAVSVADGAGVNTALCADVSPSGARLSLDRPMAAGETVTISFSPEVTLTGRVAWVEGAECGIDFAAAVAGSGREGLPAMSHGRSQASSPALRNGGFRDGLRVKVVLPDCEKKAVLRWTEDNFASVTIQR